MLLVLPKITSRRHEKGPVTDQSGGISKYCSIKSDAVFIGTRKKQYWWVTQQHINHQEMYRNGSLENAEVGAILG